MLLEDAKDHLAKLSAFVAGLEPGTLSPEDGRRLLDLGAAMVAVGSGLELLVTPVALAAATWAEEGYRSAAAWLAEATGSSVPEAVSVIDTAKKAEKLPALAEALSAGQLSPTQAKVVASAASADPASESQLIEAATTLPMAEFSGFARTVARDARQADPEHHKRLHAARFFHSWVDTEGVLRFSGGVTPEDGVPMLSAVRSRAAFVAAEGRRAGLAPESQAAYDADALVALVVGDERRATFAGTESGACGRPSVVYHVSAEALERGEVWPGELSEVSGVGPVPLQLLDCLIGEAHQKVVIGDGADVTRVVHLGRAVPATVKSALEGRDRSCVVPNCEVSVGLEIDHWQIPFARGGPTELSNLCRLCRMHHRMKTYDGYRLLGGPGKWEWLPPE